MVYNLFSLFEIIALSIFFYKTYKQQFAKIIVIVMAVVSAILWILLYFKLGSSIYYNNFVTFENVLLLCYILYFYFERIVSTSSQMIYTDPKFWIITAYLVFTSGTFFLFLYYPTLTPEERQQFYLLNYVFAIVKTILLTVAMFMKNKPEQRKRFHLT
jgi:hypothetical protein